MFMPIILCLVLTVFLPAASQAQQSGKVPRIGLLFGLSPAVNTELIQGFRQGLRELGYNEGVNVALEYQFAQNWRPAPVSL